MKKALVVGIDKYSTSPLTGCVNDAVAIANTLERNGDGSPNFSVKLLNSDDTDVTSSVVHDALVNLFQGDAETALFFFAGHGIINPATNAGYIVSQDGKKPSWGISLSEILELANKAHPRIKSTVIILDSCQSGYAGEISGIGTEGQVSVIGNGVTILTACHRESVASEIGGHGLFTGLLLEGLSGSAADVCGRITPAGVYALIDQTLGPWEQRPIYKANVQTFVTLRQIAPKIPLEILRSLPTYFPDATSVFKLDPSYEPDRDSMTEEMRKQFPLDDNKQRIFKGLQMCNRHGLVVPVDAEHMYFAAIQSTGCTERVIG